jgi:hypothetical protein
MAESSLADLAESDSEVAMADVGEASAHNAYRRASNEAAGRR